MDETYKIQVTIDGLILRPLQKHSDERGWLIELFRGDWFGEKFKPAMSYVSLTLPGQGRGPHEHRRQTDYFCIVGPSTFRIYLWDNRPLSKTYGQSMRFEVGEKNPMAIMIPPGVVHAYKNIGPVDGLVFNAPDELYKGVNRQFEPDEIRYEDDKSGRFVID